MTQRAFLSSFSTKKSFHESRGRSHENFPPGEFPPEKAVKGLCGRVGLSWKGVEKGLGAVGGGNCGTGEGAKPAGLQVIAGTEKWASVEELWNGVANLWNGGRGSCSSKPPG